MQVNWQMETNYYPTHVRLTLASKLFQIDRYIFFLIFGGWGEKKRAFKFWNMKLQLIIQLCVINAVLPFFLSCKLWLLMFMSVNSDTPGRSLGKYFKYVWEDITGVGVVYCCKKYERIVIFYRQLFSLQREGVNHDHLHTATILVPAMGQVCVFWTSQKLHCLVNIITFLA